MAQNFMNWLLSFKHDFDYVKISKYIDFVTTWPWIQKNSTLTIAYWDGLHLHGVCLDWSSKCGCSCKLLSVFAST